MLALLAQQGGATAKAATAASFVLIPKEDPTGKMLFVCAVLAIGLTCFTALQTVLAALMPTMRQSLRQRIEAHPLLSALFGVLLHAVLLGPAIYLYSSSFIVRLLSTEILWARLGWAIALAAVDLTLTFLGAVGVISSVAERARALHGSPCSGVKATAWSTVGMVLACWFPIVGWFVLCPILLCLAAGGLVGLLLPGRKAAKP